MAYSLAMLTWKRLYPGHYVTRDAIYYDRYEIIRLPEGWEWSDTGTGATGVEHTLREAKDAVERS
jgi:hypothetical protein